MKDERNHALYGGVAAFGLSDDFNQVLPQNNIETG